MQARYYDPVIGRFYSNDPIDAASFISQGNIQGFNRFAYANNNPYKYVDHNGKSPTAAGGAGAGFAVAGPPGAVVGGIIGFGIGLWIGDKIADAVFTESADPIEAILKGASNGDKTKGKSKNFDKLGGMDEANDDFDSAVDPDTIESITDSKGGEGRRGTVNDGSGRKINVRPNSTDGRPSIEVTNGKRKTKIRYGKKLGSRIPRKTE